MLAFHPNFIRVTLKGNLKSLKALIALSARKNKNSFDWKFKWKKVRILKIQKCFICFNRSFFAIFRRTQSDLILVLLICYFNIYKPLIKIKFSHRGDRIHII